jgi:UDP-N-acetyl-alpha-D-muramoyl-L-alanyl-L-glutamate epimerase
MQDGDRRVRAEKFTYRGLEITDRSLRGHFDSDGQHFCEVVEFEGVDDLTLPGVRAAAELWYLLAGLSYYKTGAAHTVDTGDLTLSPADLTLFHAALRDGLGEFRYRNELPWTTEVTAAPRALHDDTDVHGDASRVLTPFGGGIDSVVTVHALSEDLEQALFIVSPLSGTFAPLEATAAVTGRPIIRATRSLDPVLLAGRAEWFNGHVPVTAMITLLAATAAVASGRGGVVMSNEHSASVPNVEWSVGDEVMAVNHQWSKSGTAEQLLGDALARRLGPNVVVASALRDRSELWVAQQFASLPQYHDTFRSCNRAFTQDPLRRQTRWCGECDKCLFIHLVLAPFVARERLAVIFGAEPLADPARREQLRTLVGKGSHRKPFECVGDPDECAVALMALRDSPAWRDVDNVTAIAPLLTSDRSLPELLERQGGSRAPAAWLR